MMQTLFSHRRGSQSMWVLLTACVAETVSALSEMENIAVLAVSERTETSVVTHALEGLAVVPAVNEYAEYVLEVLHEVNNPSMKSEVDIVGVVFDLSFPIETIIDDQALALDWQSLLGQSADVASLVDDWDQGRDNIELPEDSAAAQETSWFGGEHGKEHMWWVIGGVAGVGLIIGIVIAESSSSGGSHSHGGSIPPIPPDSPVSLKSFWMIDGNGSYQDHSYTTLATAIPKLDAYFDKYQISAEQYNYAYLLTNWVDEPKKSGVIADITALKSLGIDKLEIWYYVDLTDGDGGFMQDCSDVSGGVAEIINLIGKGQNIIYEHSGSRCIRSDKITEEDFIKAYKAAEGGDVASTGGPANGIGSLKTLTDLDFILPQIYDTGDQTQDNVTNYDWQSAGDFYGSATEFQSYIDQTVFMFSVEPEQGSNQYGHINKDEFPGQVPDAFASMIHQFSKGLAEAGSDISKLNIAAYEYTSDNGGDEYGFYYSILEG